MEQNSCPQNHPPGASEANDFGHVVKHHAAMVHAAARRITCNAALAEDVTQETFLALARQGDHALESVAAWLCRVAGRKAKNTVRGEARRRRQEAAAAALASSDADDSRRTMLEIAISQLLSELPTPWKECLEEHYHEGRTQQEIAQRRGISQATVSRYLDAGLRELKKKVRSKGLMTGATLATLASTQAASASSLPSTSWSGTITASGTPCSASVSAFPSFILSMKAPKILFAVVVAAAVLLPAAFLLGRPKPPFKPAVPKPAKAQPSSGFVSSHPTKTRSMTTVQEQKFPDPVKPDMRSKVDALVRRFAGLSNEQLAVDPEFQKLRYRFFGNYSGPASPRLLQAMDELAAALGPDRRPPGTSASLSLPQSAELEEPRGRTWLEVASSGDPTQTQEWVVIQYQRAALEFLMAPTLKRSSNGVEVIEMTNLEAKPDGQ